MAQKKEKEKKMSDAEKLLLSALGAVRDIREKLKELKEKLDETKKVEKKPIKKVKGKPGTCACGCGEETKPGSKFVRGHNFRK